MACSKYATKRRERGDCMADATGGLQGMPKERERKPTRGSRKRESAKRGWGMVKGRVLGRTEGTIRRTGSGRTENARARSER